MPVDLGPHTTHGQPAVEHEQPEQGLTKLVAFLSVTPGVIRQPLHRAPIDVLPDRPRASKPALQCGTQGPAQPFVLRSLEAELRTTVPYRRGQMAPQPQSQRKFRPAALVEDSR